MEPHTLHQYFEERAHFGPDIIQQIISQFRSIDLQKGEFLLTEGQVCNQYAFIESGFMRAYTYDVDGNDITTGFYAAGQIVFKVASFFNRMPSAENIQVITHCRAYYITFAQLNNLFHTLPEFREFGRSVLVKGFAALKLRMLGMINQTAEQRYHQLVQNHPEVFQHAQLKHIASYLGITDTSLSRIRKQYAGK